MKDRTYGIALLVFGLAVFYALSVGVVTFIKKAFQSSKTSPEMSEARDAFLEHRRKMKAVEDQRKDLMRRQKQFIRDNKR